MEIFGTCVQCWRAAEKPTGESFTVPYYEDRIAYVTCSKGHKSALLIQSPKYEVLVQSGAGALLDGYTMEAAAAFSAALERFFEFCVESLCLVRGLSLDVYESMFKEMARQSERQIGAFLVLHALELGAPYKVNQEIVQFRNSVIHKGQIPTPEQAQDFCSRVYTEIRRVSQALREKFPDAFNQMIGKDLERRNKTIPKDMPRATSSGVMFLNGNHEKFEDALKSYAQGRDAMRLTPAIMKMFGPLIANAGKTNPSKPE